MTQRYFHSVAALVAALEAVAGSLDTLTLDLFDTLVIRRIADPDSLLMATVINHPELLPDIIEDLAHISLESRGLDSLRQAILELAARDGGALRQRAELRPDDLRIHAA